MLVETTVLAKARAGMSATTSATARVLVRVMTSSCRAASLDTQNLRSPGAIVRELQAALEDEKEVVGVVCSGARGRASPAAGSCSTRGLAVLHAHADVAAALFDSEVPGDHFTAGARCPSDDNAATMPFT